MSTGRPKRWAASRTTSVPWMMERMVRTGWSTMSCTPTAAARWKTASQEEMAMLTARSFSTESWMIWTFGLALMLKRFSGCPVEKSSRMVIALPRERRSSARCEPINPAPPVTRKRLGVGGME